MIMKKYFNVIKSLIRNRRGFALLELIITLTLLGILLAMGFMFYSFGVVSYNIGEEQTDIQQNARLAADFIISELRVAEAVTIVDGYGDLDIDDFDMDHAEETPVYYIYVKNNAIYYQEHGDLAAGEMPGEGTNLTAILENISTNMDFELSFAKSASADKANILEFDLSAKNINSDRKYDLDTQLLVLNLDEIEEHNLSGDSGTALAYQVPAPEHPLIRRVSIQGSHSHNWDNSDDKLDIQVYVETLNVDDDKTVKLEMFRIGEGGIQEPVSRVAEKTSVIAGDTVRFYNDDSLKVPNNLSPFGSYYVSITVDCQSVSDTCDGSCGGLCLSKGQFYHIYPKLWDFVIGEMHQPPKMANVEFKTGGVPIGEEVVLGTVGMFQDTYEGDDWDNIVLFVYDVEGEEYLDDNILSIDGDFSVDKEIGELDFEVRFEGYDGKSGPDYARIYSGKELRFEFYVGGATFRETINTPDIVYYLSSLEAEPDNTDVTLTPVFDPEISEYEVTVGLDMDNIVIEAEHDNPEEVFLAVEPIENIIVKEEDHDDWIRYTIDLAAETKIDVLLMSKNDPDKIENTYSITVYRTD